MLTDHVSYSIQLLGPRPGNQLAEGPSLPQCSLTTSHTALGTWASAWQPASRGLSRPDIKPAEGRIRETHIQPTGTETMRACRPAMVQTAKGRTDISPDTSTWPVASTTWHYRTKGKSINTPLLSTRKGSSIIGNHPKYHPKSNPLTSFGIRLPYLSSIHLSL